MKPQKFSRTFARPTPTQAPLAGGCRAGAAEKDITPHLGLAMAGYSAEGKIAKGALGRLFARALVLEGVNGGRVCLCVCDLMSGTRYLLEEVARQTAVSCGITVDKLVLAGSHTHNGPGRIYGNTLYDTLAQCRSGFDRDLADWLAERIAGTILEASNRVEPAVVAVGEERLWDATKNRSLPAFPLDDWNDPGSPGETPPPGLTAEQKAVDPRLHVVAAYRAADTVPIAAFGFFGCHYTTMGVGAKFYTSDAAGFAVRQARWALETAHAGSQVVVALGASATGDVNTLRKGLVPKIDTGPELARRTGEMIGDALATCTENIRASATAVPIETRFCEPDHKDPSPGAGPPIKLPSKWHFGAPVLSGSEESPTLLFKLKLVKEGMPGTEFPSDHPHFPKSRALGPLQYLLKKLLKLAPSPSYPMHQIRIGSSLLATLPGEPSIAGARAIELALEAETGASKVFVVGYSGDYGAYLTTDAEHLEQYYEGASTIYGRHVVDYLEAFHRWLSGQSPSPAATGSVTVVSFTEDDGFDGTSVTFSDPDPKPRIERNGRSVRLRWRMREGTRLVLAEHPLVSVEEQAGSSWGDLMHMGRPFDDRWQPIHIQRKGPKIFSVADRWSARFELPQWPPVNGLRVRVPAWGSFPGFVVAIP